MIILPAPISACQLPACTLPTGGPAQLLPSGRGVAALTVMMLLWNYFITPLYMNTPREVVAAMLVPVFLPFNLVKGGMNMAATLLLYKPVVTALRRTGLVPPSTSHGQSRRASAGFFLFALVLLATFILFALVLWDVI